MHARRSGLKPVKTSDPTASVSCFLGNASLLKTCLCLFAIVCILLFQSISAIGNEIYLFMDPDDNTDSHDASHTVANLLGSMLKNELQHWTVRTVTRDKVTKPTVEKYAAAYGISWYLKVKVSSTQGGLHLDFALVAPQETFDTFINIGANKKKDSRIIRLRLRKILLSYHAMVNGISPANIIYVKCFKKACEVPEPTLLRRLTLQLPARLKETPINTQYDTTGVTHLEFERYCEGSQGSLTEEDLNYLNAFNYFIEGHISEIDGGVKIPVYVYSGDRMYTITPPSMQLDSVIDDLADYIANCWGKWDDSNCH